MMLTCAVGKGFQSLTGVQEKGPTLFPTKTPLFNFSLNLSSFSAAPSPLFLFIFFLLLLFSLGGVLVFLAHSFRLFFFFFFLQWDFLWWSVYKVGWRENFVVFMLLFRSCSEFLCVCVCVICMDKKRTKRVVIMERERRGQSVGFPVDEF
jgi:hypothetical protein